MTTDAVRDAVAASRQHLSLLVAATLNDLGESAADLGGNLPLVIEGDAVTVCRPDGSRILTVPLTRLYAVVVGEGEEDEPIHP